MLLLKQRALYLLFSSLSQEVGVISRGFVLRRMLSCLLTELVLVTFVELELLSYAAVQLTEHACDRWCQASRLIHRYNQSQGKDI